MDVLFDEMKSQMNNAEAFLSVLIVAVACDGRIRNDEAAALRKVLENRRLFVQISEKKLSSMTQNIVSDIGVKGFPVVVDEALMALSSEYHDSVVAVAAFLVGADRFLQDDEMNFLGYLSNHKQYKGRIAAESIIKSLLAFHSDKIKDSQL